MANLRGWVEGDSPTRASRQARRVIEATLATWEGKISIHLLHNGDFEVLVGPTEGPKSLFMRGNVNDRTEVILPADIEPLIAWER